VRHHSGLDSNPCRLQDHGTGRFQDDLENIEGEWKIRDRRVKNDYLVSDPAKLVNLADPNLT
jgi:hypothetical protein